MKIGFDISQTNSSNKAGCGYYAHGLIQSLLENNFSKENDFFLFSSFGDFYHDASMPLQNPYKGRAKYGPHHPTLSESKKFWLDDNLEGNLMDLDIIHANNYWCPIQLKNIRLIYTFYDFGFLINPDQWSTEINRYGCFNGSVRAAMAADWIIAISEYSRLNFLEIFPNFPKERVRVIYPSSRFDRALISPTRPSVIEQNLSGKFWLAIGTIEPRKNLNFLLDVYQKYIELGGKIKPLVLAGGSGWMNEEFNLRLRKLDAQIPIITTGYVTDEELLWLYENCYANLYPSLFEGFGLPILEAMQFGAATICSNTSSMPEVAGKAAIQLDPYQKDLWANAMLSLSQKPEMRNQLISAGLLQAKKFNAEQNTKQIIALYEEAISLPKRLVL